MNPPFPLPAESTDDRTALMVKRYEDWVRQKSKALKGKGKGTGNRYWGDLQPILNKDPATGQIQAVLQCVRCKAEFSDSNTSRVFRHLKLDACRNFPSSPGLQILRTGPALTETPNHESPPALYNQISHLDNGDPPSFQHPLLQPGVNGGSCTSLVVDGSEREPETGNAPPPPIPAPPKPHATVSAVSLLAECLESCGAESFSSVIEKPQFRTFLHQVGLPAVTRQDLFEHRRNAQYKEAWSESEHNKFREASFFQISFSGWKQSRSMTTAASVADGLVNDITTVNFPDGTSVSRKAPFSSGTISSYSSKQILHDAVKDICCGEAQRCVGIVTDKFEVDVLKDLEKENSWMVNIPCIFQGLNSLIKDIAREVPLFDDVTSKCLTVINFFRAKFLLHRISGRYELLSEFNCHSGLLRVLQIELSLSEFGILELGPVLMMLDGMIAMAHELWSFVRKKSYEEVFTDDPIAEEVKDMILDMEFWTDLKSVRSLVKLFKKTAKEIEAERPLVGQCLPLWDHLQSKISKWFSNHKFDFEKGMTVEKVMKKWFKKYYHPAWAAAYVLDPLYLIWDNSKRRYVLPFQKLTSKQKKDVKDLVKRLSPHDENDSVTKELEIWLEELDPSHEKWLEGLDPSHANIAKAVKMKHYDKETGRIRLGDPQIRRHLWEAKLSEFRYLGKVALRLIFLHATSCG